MCEFNPKNDSRRIDPCIRSLINHLNELFKASHITTHLEILACCCGHNKYPLTVIIKNKSLDITFDLVSDIEIPRKKRFYKKDNKGYYYIPEVLNVAKEKSK